MNVWCKCMNYYEIVIFLNKTLFKAIYSLYMCGFVRTCMKYGMIVICICNMMYNLYSFFFVLYVLYSVCPEAADGN